MNVSYLYYLPLFLFFFVSAHNCGIQKSFMQFHLFLGPNQNHQSSTKKLLAKNQKNEVELLLESISTPFHS